MEKIVIHKNKSDVFNCNFEIDGASPEEVVVRLCLEFSDNKNMFFHGKIATDGQCTVTIPRLTEIENKHGKLTIEAIANSMYFKLYEAEVDLKNSVEVKMKEGFLHKEEPVKETKIEISNIVKKPKVIEEQKKPKKLSKVDVPKVDVPKVDVPKVDVPKVDVPKVDVPIENPFISPKDKVKPLVSVKKSFIENAENSVKNFREYINKKKIG